MQTKGDKYRTGIVIDRRSHEGGGRLAGGLAVLALLVSAGLSVAGDVNWTNTLGGVFATGGNWLGGAAPGGLDRAVFNVSGSYGVRFDAGAPTERLYINAGTLRFDLGGNTYSLSGAAPAFLIGDTGSAALTVTNGTLSAAADGRLGNQTAGNGTLIVGTNGSVSIATGFQTGYYGSGFLTVRDGGQLQCSSSLYVGYSPAGSAVKSTVTVTGNGSRLATGYLCVGAGNNYANTNTLTISNGGQTFSSQGHIGYNVAASRGHVAVQGAGSVWSINGELNVGNTGSGTMVIEDGATVTNKYTFIARAATAVGALTVKGANSLIRTTTTGIFVGGSTSAAGGVGLLAVEDGAVAHLGTQTLNIWSTGTVRGNGSITAGAVNNRGTLRPGLYTVPTAGTLSITGPLTLTDATSVIHVRVFKGGVCDKLTVSGALKLGGVLNIGFTGYQNTTQRTFNLLDWGSLSGTFSAVNIAGINPSLVTLDNLYIDGSITVRPTGTLVTIR